MQTESSLKQKTKQCEEISATQVAYVVDSFFHSVGGIERVRKMSWGGRFPKPRRDGVLIILNSDSMSWKVVHNNVSNSICQSLTGIFDK